MNKKMGAVIKINIPSRNYTYGGPGKAWHCSEPEWGQTQRYHLIEAYTPNTENRLDLFSLQRASLPVVKK